MFDCSTSTLRYVVKKEGPDLHVKVDSPAMVSDAFVAPSGSLWVRSAGCLASSKLAGPVWAVFLVGADHVTKSPETAVLIDPPAHLLRFGAPGSIAC
jgi:hypothetical protein